jgi:hypothetical protein
VVCSDKQNPKYCKSKCIYYYVLMYENGKMRPVETILRREREIKENDGGG